MMDNSLNPSDCMRDLGLGHKTSIQTSAFLHAPITEDVYVPMTRQQLLYGVRQSPRKNL